MRAQGCKAAACQCKGVTWIPLKQVSLGISDVIDSFCSANNISASAGASFQITCKSWDSDVVQFCVKAYLLLLLLKALKYASAQQSCTDREQTGSPDKILQRLLEDFGWAVLHVVAFSYSWAFILCKF